jgi:ent-kaurenoic acid hydroxylase
MEMGFSLMVFTTLMGGFVAMCWLLKSANEWYYVSKLGGKHCSLPPGDMGWPLIGNMWDFLFAFKYGDPDSFITNLVSRSLSLSLSLSLSHGLINELSLFL